jgi:OOP family OmpA-OmpF porin
MRRFLFIAITTCSLVQAQAQFTVDYLKAADDYYRKGDFYSAAQYYEKYLGAGKGATQAGYQPYTVTSTSRKGTAKGSNREEAIYHAAESYRQLNYHAKAEPFYQQAAGFDKSVFPLAKYHLATTLRALGRFEEAEKRFTEFKDEYGQADAYAEAAQREILNLRFIQQQLRKPDLNTYTITRGAGALNDTGATYAPVWLGNETLLLTSTRPEAGGKEGFVNRVYTATYAGGALTGLTRLALPDVKDVHQGVVSVTPDGGTLYLTRWTTDNGKKVASLFRSQRTDGGWTDPRPVDALNVPGFSSQQPFVMPDGSALLFSSDRPGGLGGFDLYSAELKPDGSVGGITNPGAVLNTASDEQAPYYHAASHTFVFASNGRVGMGEFDLFFTKNTNGSWTEPQNFGYPVNSVKDDIYFASKGTAANILGDVLFSSDRASACCLEVFSLNKTIRPKLIGGTVVDCATGAQLPLASVSATGEKSQPLFSGATSAAGSYTFQMDAFEGVTVTAQATGYTTNAVRASVPTDEAAERLDAPVLCLNKIPEVGTVEVLENVYFRYDRAEVLDESHASLDKLAQRLKDNPSISIEIGGHTDSNGEDTYNRKLSEARAKNVVDYLVSQGIDAGRLIAKGYGESQPLAPNTNADGSDNPAGREKNRRTEFKVIKN